MYILNIILGMAQELPKADKDRREFREVTLLSYI